MYVNLGAGNLNKIRFTYDAGGMKLRKQVFNNANVSQIKQDYVQGIEYRNDTIEAIYTSEGRAVWVPLTSTWRYEFNVTDHLGNVRAVLSDLNNNKTLDITTNATTNEIINVTSYYPFGMVMANSNFANNTTTPDTKYQYNGKEYNGDVGLNLLDYGARWYDPVVGRFTGIDPIAEKFNWVNPYNYAENEPIANIDLWGMQKMPASLIPEAKQQLEQSWVDFKSNISKRIEAATNFIEKNAESAQSYISKNAPAMIATADKIQYFGKNLKDASLLTTLASGGATAEVTIPSAAAGALMEGGMKVFKGVVSLIVDDQDGKSEMYENIANKVLDVGEGLIMSSTPMSAPVKASTEILFNKINEQLITPTNNKSNTP